MSDTLKSIWFAAVTALISSLLLTGASSGLKEFRLNNIKIDNQKNLLKSVSLVRADGHYSGAEIEKIYRDNIQSCRVNDSGEITPDSSAATSGQPLFLYVRNKAIQAYILPVHSRGLLGKIDG